MTDPLITWKPKDVVILTNTADQTLLLDLDSGPQRLDKGRTLRITADALDQPAIKALVDAGKISVERWKKGLGGVGGSPCP